MAYQTEIVLLTSPAPTDGTDTEDLSSGGNIYVGQNVDVVDESNAGGSTPIYGDGYGSAIIDGFVYGYNAVTFAGLVNANTSIDIGATGNVSSFGGAQNAAVEVQTGIYNIDNAGTIQAIVTAVNLDYNGASGVGGSGGGTLDNTGVIESNEGDAVWVGDTSATDQDFILNGGTISGGILNFGSSVLTIDNTGTLDGDANVAVEGNETTAAIVLHNEGKIDGDILLVSNGSSLIDSGEIEGSATVSGNVEITGTGVISPDSSGTALDATGAAYDIKNAGEILGEAGDGVDVDGNGTIVNTGVISSSHSQGVSDSSGEGDVGVLYNSGTISGPGSGAGVFDAVHETGGHATTIFNTGVIDGGSDGSSGSAIYGDATTVVSLHNSGQIDGQVALDAAGSAISNTGHIDGWVTLAGETAGTADFLNGKSGVVTADSGQDALTIASGSFLISNAGEISAATSGPASATGIVLDASGGGGGALFNSGSIYGDSDGIQDYATSGVAYVYNYGTISSDDDVAVYDAQGTTGHAVQLFNTGTISSPDIAVFATALDQEKLVNKGDIEGKIDLAAASSVIDNWGAIAGAVDFAGASGVLVNDGAIEGGVTFTGSYDVYNGLLGEVTGVVYGSGFDGIFYAGADAETFDFAVADPSYVAGGAGPDTFEFDVSTLTSATTIVGGSGADTIQLLTAGTIAASAFGHMRGIAAITLANGINNLTIGNALASTANGGVLTINGGTSADTIDISAVATTSDHVEVYGGGGADLIKAGAAVDTFGYHAVSNSTGTTYDTIKGVNFAHDYFDVSAVVAGGVAGINAAVTTGSLSTATFNTDLGTAIGAAQLGAGDAVLFTPNAGTLEGQTFLIVDANHTAGYQANADFVINVTGATGTLATTNFV